MVTPDSIRSYKLDKRSVIEAAAERVYELLTARTKKIPNETSRQQKNRIAKADLEYVHAAWNLKPYAPGACYSQLGTKRLLIVSDDALQYIPVRRSSRTSRRRARNSKQNPTGKTLSGTRVVTSR